MGVVCCFAEIMAALHMVVYIALYPGSNYAGSLGTRRVVVLYALTILIVYELSLLY